MQARTEAVAPAASRDALAGNPVPGAENLFTSRSWADVIVKTYGFSYHRPENARSIPAIALIEDALGQRLVAPAFGDYAMRDPVPSLATQIEAVREAFPAAGITLKIAGTAALPDANITRRALLHEIDPCDCTFSSSFKRNVAKGRRAGVTIEARTDDEALAMFFAMYARQRIRKFAALPQPYEFFRNIASAFFPDRGFILLALSQGRAIAALFVLRHRNRLYYKFGASDPGALDLRPNNVLMAHLVELARAHEIDRLDLGMTPGEGGLARFKRSMGARELPCSTYSWSALEGADRAIAEKSKLIGEITAKLVAGDPDPDEASRYGAAFYRYFA